MKNYSEVFALPPLASALSAAWRGRGWFRPASAGSESGLRRAEADSAVLAGEVEQSAAQVNGRGRLSALLAALLAALVACPPAQAFPPAPPHTLSGLVRNQWGDPINLAGAIVYLQTSNSVGVKAAVAASVEPGVNYRLPVPMDAGTAPDLYLPTALRRGQSFQLRVQIGTVTYLPIEMTLGPASL